MDKLDFLQKQKGRLERLKSNLLPSQEDDFLDKTSRLTNLINILENDKSINKDILKKEENNNALSKMRHGESGRCAALQ